VRVETRTKTFYVTPDGTEFDGLAAAEDHATGLALTRLGIGRDDLARMQANREDDARLAILWVGARLLPEPAPAGIGHNGGPALTDEPAGPSFTHTVVDPTVPAAYVTGMTVEAEVAQMAAPVPDLEALARSLAGH
jgi:hypothetical protein